MPRLMLTDARLATMDGPAPYGLVEDGAMAIEGDRIAWVGAMADRPSGWPERSLAGRLVTPGLIDCHTHLVHGGNRAREFEARLMGASYADIARAGGGILATVAATRGASEDDLVATALPRLDALIAEGVTSVEIKSGYGLDTQTELRMLRAARRLGELRPVRVRTTYLGAHAVPPGQSADAYLDQVCLPLLDRLEGLADAVDGFCEGIAFSPAQIDRLFTAARARGLAVKLHAEQLSNLGGAALAARHGALSADHLEYLDADGVAALAAAGTVAVLLPGAYYTLREPQAPPVAALQAAGVPVALATDCNPGSSPLTSPLLTMNLAATLWRMTPDACLRGVTAAAARALGLAERGRLAPGALADLAVWDVAHPAELVYRMGLNPLAARVFGGIFGSTAHPPHP